jgi:hypothetical protein
MNGLWRRRPGSIAIPPRRRDPPSGNAPPPDVRAAVTLGLICAILLQIIGFNCNLPLRLALPFPYTQRFHTLGQESLVPAREESVEKEELWLSREGSFGELGRIQVKARKFGPRRSVHPNHIRLGQVLYGSQSEARQVR